MNQTKSDYNLSFNIFIFFIFSELILRVLSISLLGSGLGSSLSFGNITLVILVLSIFYESALHTKSLPFKTVSGIELALFFLIILSAVDYFFKGNSISQSFMISGSLSLSAIMCFREICISEKRFFLILRYFVLFTSLTAFMNILIVFPAFDFIPRLGSGQESVTGLAINRQAGFSLGPDVFGVVCLSSIVIIIMSFYEKSQSIFKYSRTKIFLLLILLTALILGQSRGVYLNFLVIIFIFYLNLLLSTKGSLRMFFVFFGAAILLAVGLYIANNANDLFSNREFLRQYLERVYYLVLSVEAFLANPVFGSTNFEVFNGLAPHPHNSYLQLMLSQGFLPLIAVFYIMFSYLRKNGINNKNISTTFFLKLIALIVFIANMFYMGLFQKLNFLLLSLNSVYFFVVRSDRS